MLKYSIIIPVCNKEELTKACLDSIQKCSNDHEVIIVDNGSRPSWKGPEFVIRNDRNLGFPKAINQGIKQARGEIIVLLNNDTVVSPHWLERLDAHLKNYDMVGPVTNFISGPQQLTMSSADLPGSIFDVSEGIYEANAGRAWPFHRLVFFCVAIKREVIEKVGLLDEQFSPGNYEDEDYCMRAIEAGFRLGIASDVFIYHFGNATHKALNLDYVNLMRTNLEKFQTKWPLKKYSLMKEKAKINCAQNLPLPKRTLALVMVVRNEELGLERAILSVRDFVDEIVIAVDNSSTDGTLEIAKKYATTLKRFDWRDDFAWARNFAHEGVKSDWILFLDGHEFVQKYTNLDFMLSSPADALLCSVELENDSTIRNPRIYKNGLQFEGAIHEIQNYKTLTVYSEFLVIHGRLDGQAEDSIAFRKEQSNSMVPRIMGKQLKDDPSNTRASLHLALHNQSQGFFREALKYQKLYFKHSNFKGERWFMYFNQALCHFSLGHRLRALWATDNAEKETSRRWEIAKLRGLIYFNQGNYNKAVKFFVDSFDVNRGDTTYKPWKKDHSEIWNLIGECYFRLGKLSPAGEAFNEAFKNCQDATKKKMYYDRSNLMKKRSRPL